MFKQFTALAAIFLLCVTSAQAFETSAREAVIADFETGSIIMNHNADQTMAPSSMSKLMTVYILFDYLKQGRVHLDDTLPVSEKAWRMQGSKMFVPIGDQIKVEDLIRGIIVQSGNDACIVVAEGLAGSEENFAALMNKYAEKMGLTGSHFMNSTGWPDENHYMTAMDLSKLARHLINDLPEYYHYFSEPEFTYHGITQQNRNLLLAKDLGVDGLKTGHTEIAGFGIVVSAKQAERRVIVVINGMPSMADRAQEAENLVRYAFREFENVRLFDENKTIAEAPVWMGKGKTVALKPAKAVTLVMPKSQMEHPSINAVYNSPLLAPVKAGTPAGKLVITYKDSHTEEVELVAAEDVEKKSGMDWYMANLQNNLLPFLAN